MSLENFLPLRREVMKHWIYKDSDYFKVWVEMLFVARFSKEPKKELYNGSLYTLKQSEFLFSRTTWTTRLNIKEHKLRKLVKLLIDEQMLTKIGRVGSSGATIYSICNYKKYNNSASDTPAIDIDNSGVEYDSHQPLASDTPAIDQPLANDTPLKKKENKEKKVKESKKDKLIESVNLHTNDKGLITAMIDFMDMRSSIKKPMTERAITLMFGKLNKLSTNTNEQIEILEQSTMSNWQGIFELKQNNSANTKSEFRKQIDAMEDW